MSTKRRISEKDLLKMLAIPSFRHMTKEKLADFVSALPDIDPDVAKKALEQFPDFSAAITKIVDHYRSIISESLESSSAETRCVLETCAFLVESLQHGSENDNLTFEQRELLIEKCQQIVQMMREIAQDEKRFKLNIAVVATVGVIAVTAVMASVLGSRISFSMPNLNRRS